MLTTLSQKLQNPARLAALRRTTLLDSPAEAAFDRLTNLACRLLRAPVALVSLVDVDRQFFKSAIGLPEPFASRRETPLSHSFCQHVVASGDELLVADARADVRVCDSLAIPDLGVIGYAGIPLVTSDGHVLGSFCAIDTQPRQWTEEEIGLLRDLAASAITEIELRITAAAAEEEARGRERALARLRQSEEQLRAVLDNTSAVVSIKDRDGQYLLVNEQFGLDFGCGPERAVGRKDADLFSAQVARALRRSDAQVLETGQPVRVEETMPRGGSAHTYISAKVPLHDADGEVYAVCTVSTDITAQKTLERELEAALAKEHHIAEELQRSLLFDLPQDLIPGLHLATFYEAAWEEASVGGDFFDVFALEGGRVALVVGDASGKGLAAAIRNAEVKYALRAFLREDRDPARALERLNRYVVASQQLAPVRATSDAFLVLSLLIISPLTGEGQVATAGAEPPLLLGRDGRTETVDARGLLLGVTPDAAYTTTSLSLRPGDSLVMLTDGITEARLGRDLFGYERMTRLAQQSQSLGLRQMGQAILNGARAFAGGALQDDVCLLLVQRR